MSQLLGALVTVCLHVPGSNYLVQGLGAYRAPCFTSHQLTAFPGGQASAASLQRPARPPTKCQDVDDGPNFVTLVDSPVNPPSARFHDASWIRASVCASRVALCHTVSMCHCHSVKVSVREYKQEPTRPDQTTVDLHSAPLASRGRTGSRVSSIVVRRLVPSMFLRLHPAKLQTVIFVCSVCTPCSVLVLSKGYQT